MQQLISKKPFIRGGKIMEENNNNTLRYILIFVVGLIIGLLIRSLFM